MKLSWKNLSLYLIILLSLISLSLSTKSKSRMRMKSSSKFHSLAESKFLAEIWKAPGSPKPKYLDFEIKTKWADNFSKVVVEDWMSVSSSEFKNEAKFPVFFYPNNGIGEALVNQGDYIRINEKYRDRPPYMNSGEKWQQDPNAPPERTFFWFRLSDRFLYFTESKNSNNVLGDFRYSDDTLTAYSQNNLCFELTSKEGFKYKYCARTKKTMKKFLCYIQNKLRIDLDKVCKNSRPGGKNPKSITPGKMKEKVITQPYILIPMAREECNDGWTYRNHGKNWECLCKEGNYYKSKLKEKGSLL